MKRRRIKPNPRKATPVRDEYAAANPICEIIPYLATVGIKIYPSGGVHVHHVVGGAGRKDFVSNIITVDAPAIHNLIEDDVRTWRVVCLLAKWRKKPHEINEAEFRDCKGERLIGWLENNPPGVMPQVWADYKKMIAWLKRRERAANRGSNGVGIG